MAVTLTAGGGLLTARLAAGCRAGKGASDQTQQWSRVSCCGRAERAARVWEVQEQWSRVSCCFSAVPSSRGRRRALTVVKAAGEGVETEVETKVAGDVLPSDQWPENFSLLNFEDLSAHYEPILFKAEAQPETYLGDVMSKTIFTAFPDQTLAEIDHFFSDISGVPVVDEDFKVVGVLSKKDRSKASDMATTKVKEVMSTPAITLPADRTVKDAAVLMLKNKIHRIPIVNSTYHVVGIVTRTDIFTALET